MTSSSLRSLTPALLLLICVLLSSCADKVPTEYDSDQIMPLKVGNRWIAKVTDYPPVQVGSVWLDTIELVGRGSKSECHENTGKEYLDRNGVTYFYRGRELFFAADDCASLALYPSEKGDTFGTLPTARIILPDSSGGTELVEQIIAFYVFTSDTSIAVPVGTFRCYEFGAKLIEPRDRGLQLWREHRRFYSPGIGPIYQEIRDEHQKLVQTWELIEYEVF